MADGLYNISVKETENNAQGFLLVDKKEGWTSTDVDRQAKKIFHQRRVGHLGTLDPFATGLLILAIGEMTKFLPLLDDRWKVYRAKLVLGTSTATGDSSGDILAEKEVPPLTKEEINLALKSLLGKSMQVPPMYSAKRINGERAYDLARQGKDVHLSPQEIEVSEIFLIDYDEDRKAITFQAMVSKGTYLRTLGMDIAHRLKTEGHLAQLRRLQVGPYLVKDAIDILEANRENLLPLTKVLEDCRALPLSDENLVRAKNGSTLFLSPQSAFLLVEDQDRQPIALYQRKGKVYHCVRGFRHD